jgi:hypothetical protein
MTRIFDTSPVTEHLRPVAAVLEGDAEGSRPAMTTPIDDVASGTLRLLQSFGSSRYRGT